MSRYVWQVVQPRLEFPVCTYIIIYIYIHLNRYFVWVLAHLVYTVRV